MIKSSFLIRLLSPLFLATLLLSQQVQAERLLNLYTLSSLVADTSDEQRAVVANVLLRELLVRVSGTERVLEKMPPEDFSKTPELYSESPHFELWTEITSAQHLINQYSYTASSQLLTTSSGEQVNAQQLELTFGEAGVKQLLRRLQAPVWDVNRPKVLFWVALEGRGGRTLITPESNLPLSNVLISQSEKRGVPYLLPNFSLHPVADTLFSDIWGGFSQQIITASEPYQADAIAVGKVRASGKHWRVEWLLLTGMSSVSHTASVATLRDVLQEGVNFTAEQLSSRYASHASQNAGTYKIMVSNLRQVQDYAAINSYLNNLSLTRKVRVVYSADQRVLFEVTLRGGLDQLSVNLTLDNRLKEESFLGLQQSTNYPKQPVTDQQNKPMAEQADAYFRWEAN